LDIMMQWILILLENPLRCVAVDVVDGKEYVFRKGSLPVAMRASMAIPAVFTPVRMDSMVLVDGGLNNNYPADVAREMGAEIIIGVDLGTSDLKELKGLNSPGM
jgi:NTE family protein